MNLFLRTVTLLVCLLGVLFSLIGEVAIAAPAPTPVRAPGAPSNLSITVPGNSTALGAGSWTKNTTLLFHFQVAGGDLVPQIEIEPSTVAFTGTSNYSGTPSTSAGQATVKVDGLSNGRTYHWQARMVDALGASSPWVAYTATSTSDVGIDQNAPSRPVIRSTTNPQENHWYNTSAPALAWSSQDDLSGIAGYSYVVERQARVIPPGQISSQATTRLPNLADGVWIFAVRSVDRAGNWSPTATYRLQLDRHAPRFTWLSPTRSTFNPYKGPTMVRFTLDQDAKVRLALYRVGSRNPVETYMFSHVRPGQVTRVTWNGKTHQGKPVVKGYYFFGADASDEAGNTSHWNVGGISVVPQEPHRTATGQILYPGDGKRIIVSLSRETLYAYDGDRLALQTVVTTGNPRLPTPLGTYAVTGKYHPYKFISPWPAGSQNWYPSSLSQYAMLFRDGGYFLHDAPWRSAFGPGTDGPGKPGTNYGGTHGCVNIPPGAMLLLWNWTPVGTSVQVVP